MILKRLRSNTGASLTFALLLFLVCSVVGSVVLAAGSAAAGRASKLSQSDQRYHAVSSAAEFLASELSGKGNTITVIRTRTQTDTVTTAYRYQEMLDNGRSLNPPQFAYIPGTTERNSQVEYTTKIYSSDPLTGSPVFDESGSQSSGGYPMEVSRSFILGARQLSFLTAQAVQLMYGTSDDSHVNSCNTEAAMGYSFSRSGIGVKEGSFTLAPQVEEEAAALLQVECTYRLLRNGTLRITVDQDGYSMTVTLEPVFRTETPVTVTEPPSTDPAPENIPAADYTQTTTTVTTLTKTESIYWEVKSIG